ncbi:hypothetical protein SAMN06265348_11563 [Pedobacter westerhofensis]|uniref:Uncharacterized protein n=1 Tax=Pedobacter westerhofensis TaxID=425512 RepID=A0A521FNZ7_9SPHI|nr:hypothetical protein [Pedobacter westerhofensis]SMO97935.1 hypothetical protein SAMN06265348_11563 [Pedobacter westerhofensis]
MNTREIKQISFEDYMDVILGTFSGLTGGTVLGSAFGFTGGIIGALLGSFISGYDAYKTVCKNYSASVSGKMPEDH